MVAAAEGSKLIFTVLIHRRSPKRFREDWERRLQHSYPDSAMRERYRNEVAASCPPLHRYNDIAGFAELYWDGGTRILVDYFFRGDRSRKFGKQVARSWPEDGARISPGKFYLFALGVESGGIPHETCDANLKRKAILEALREIRIRATDLCCFVDLTHEHELLQAIDINLLFQGSTQQ